MTTGRGDLDLGAADHAVMMAAEGLGSAEIPAVDAQSFQVARLRTGLFAFMSARRSRLWATASKGTSGKLGDAQERRSRAAPLSARLVAVSCAGYTPRAVLLRSASFWINLSNPPRRISLAKLER